MKVRPVLFQPWHYKMAEPGIHFKKIGTDPEVLAWAHRRMEGITLLVGEDIAAILGVSPLWGRVYEATMLPTEHFYKSVKTCLKYAQYLTDLAFDTLPVDRIQATALASEPKHQRFLEAVGFEREGLARKYAPDGADLIIYAKVRV